MLWGTHILKVMYLPFKFKLYPKQNLANGFEKTKWQQPSWNLRLFKDFFFFFPLAKQEEIGKKHMDSG